MDDRVDGKWKRDGPQTRSVWLCVLMVSHLFFFLYFFLVLVVLVRRIERSRRSPCSMLLALLWVVHFLGVSLVFLFIYLMTRDLSVDRSLAGIPPNSRRRAEHNQSTKIPQENRTRNGNKGNEKRHRKKTRRTRTISYRRRRRYHRVETEQKTSLFKIIALTGQAWRNSLHIFSLPISRSILAIL